MNEKDVSSLISGLRKLRTGALLQITAVILSIIAVIYLFTIMGLSMLTMEPRMMFGAMLSSLLGIGVLGVIIGILLLLGFIYWFTATGDLENYNSRLGIGKTGVIIVIVGIILAILGALLLVGLPGMGFMALGGFMFFIGIGGLLVLIGWILFSIMLIRLGDLEEVSDSIHTAGILYLIGIILSLIPYLNIVGNILVLIAVIMVYSGAGSTLDRLKSI
jgi:hypothetical protein